MNSTKTFRNKVLPKVAGLLGRALLSLLIKTCKITPSGLHNIPKDHRWILSLWHNRLSITALLLKRYTTQTFAAVVSQSKDGEIIASFIESYKRGKTIRVAHNRRFIALKEIIEHIRKSSDVLVFTPDGPRGPRYKVKQGLLKAAVETETKIIPLTWSASHFFQLKTWDKMLFPKPFSQITVVFGEAIDPSIESLNEEMIGERMLALDREAVEKAARGSSIIPD